MIFFSSEEVKRIENQLLAMRENPIAESQCNRCMAFRTGAFPRFKNCVDYNVCCYCVDYNVCCYFDGI